MHLPTLRSLGDFDDRRRRLRPHHPGFTLIELMMVCGIIAILISVLVVGANHLSHTSRIRSTRVTLENLRGMLTELEATTPNQRGVVDMELNIYGANVNSPTLPTIAAPTDVNESTYISGSSSDRYQSAAVQATQKVMDQLYQLPQVRDMISKLPVNRRLKPLNNTNQERAPILLDEWSNPIIYVPSGGMTGVQSSSGLNPPVPTGGHGYFASAGPDGCFTGLPGHTYKTPPGDDNLYGPQN